MMMMMMILMTEVRVLDIVTCILYRISQKS